MGYLIAVIIGIILGAISVYFYLGRETVSGLKELQQMKNAWQAFEQDQEDLAMSEEEREE